MLNCRDTTRLLSEAQERSPGVRKRLALRMHLLMCSGCQNFADQLKLLRRAARAYAGGAIDRESGQGRPSGGETDQQDRS